MAGNYPDAPSWRMAYDRDGSVGFLISGAGGVTELTAAQIVALNDETSSDLTFTFRLDPGGSVGVAFPEPRDLDAVYFNGVRTNDSQNSTASLWVSPNTTNGQDGTWTELSSTYPGAIPQSSQAPPVAPGYRVDVASETALGIRGVRIRGGGAGSAMIRALHLYGEAAPGVVTDRLDLWHPTRDEKLPPAWLDWGDVPRGSSAERQFRVRNMSTKSTARAIRVAMDVLTDATPSVVAQHLLSYGGGSFLAQVNIGDLAPGAISGPVTLRRVTPTNATLGLWALRVFAESQDWS